MLNVLTMIYESTFYWLLSAALYIGHSVKGYIVSNGQLSFKSGQQLSRENVTV